MTIADSSGDITCSGHFIFKTYTTSNMVDIDPPLTTGSVIYNSDLKELILWTGSAWNLIGGNGVQKGIIATTSFTTAWTSSTANIFKKVNSGGGFDMSFTALSPNNELVFSCFLNDGNVNSSPYFQFDVYNVDTSAYDLSAGGIVMKADETDDYFIVIKLFMLGLTVGNVYNIELHGKGSSQNNSFYIYSGGVYPNSSLFLRPLYNTTTF